MRGCDERCADGCDWSELGVVIMRVCGDVGGMRVCGELGGIRGCGVRGCGEVRGCGDVGGIRGCVG